MVSKSPPPDDLKDLPAETLRHMVHDLRAELCALQTQRRQDAEEQSIAAARLQESEERFRSVMEGIPGVAVQGYAVDGTVTFWNPASERLYGYSADEALGGNLLELIIPVEMRAGVTDAMRHMFQTGEPIPAGELLLKTQSGTLVPVFSSHALIAPVDRPPEMFCLDIDLSERKQFEAALHESERRYRTMVEWSPDAIVVHARGNLRYANPAAVTLFGAESAEQLVGVPYLRLIHPDFRAFAQARVKKIAANVSVSPMAELQCLRLDGSTVEVEVQGTAITYDGEPAIHVVIHDISERKRVEAALHDSEQRYRTMVEWSPNPIAVHRDRTFIYVNPAAIKMFGATSAQDLLGTPILDRVHPHSYASQLTRARLAEQGVALNVIEQKFLKLDGTPIDVEVQGTSIVYDGAPAIHVAWRDITERKRAEAALHESDQRLRTVLDTALDAVIEIDAEGLVTGWNTRAETMFGWLKTEAMGQPLDAMIIPERHREAHRRGLERFLNTREVKILNRRIEISAVRRNGMEFPIELSIIPLQLGNTFHFTAFVADITERTQAAEQTRLATEAIENTTREQLDAVAARIAAMDETDRGHALRRTFVNVVAHELRSPMQTLMTSADIIEMSMGNPDGPDRKELEPAVARMLHAIALMRVQLRDLAEYAKTADPKLTVRMEYFSVANLAKQVEEAHRPTAITKGLAFSVVVTPAEPAVCIGDPLRIAQAVNNLTDNAIKYTNEGSVTIALNVTEDGLLIDVTDTGIGIEDDESSLVLQPFKRGRNVPPSVSGTGIGLAVVDNIIRQMGGTLEIRSLSPRGTGISCELPLHRLNGETAPTTSS